MKEILNCTLCQTDILWNRPKENLLHYEDMLQQVTEESDLVVFPEMCLTGFDTSSTGLAETSGSRNLQAFSEMAAKYRKGIIAGFSFVENGKVYNRMQFFHPSGEHRHYDKRHLFRMGDENSLFCASNNECIFSCQGWNIYPQICYDLRFPESCRNSFSNGEFKYDCLLIIANWPHSRRTAMRTLAQARAIENQSYLLLVNRTGTDVNGIYHGGDSLFIDFKGNIIKELSDGKEGLLEANLSISELNGFREKFPTYLDWNS